MAKKYKKFHIILAVVILSSVLIPQHQASAACGLDLECYLNFYGDIGIFLQNIGEKTNKLLTMSLEQLIFQIQAYIILLVGMSITFAAGLLDSFITYQTKSNIFNIEVVKGSWAIFRNFVNLFFILALIVMAFGTIFNIQQYTWKNMLAPFLIAALLINFSLAIGQYVISVANGLSNVFLSQITQMAGNDGIGGLMSKGAEIQGTTGVVTASLGLMAQGVMSFVFLVIFFLALMSAAIFTLVRIFALWFLLIISPIAWFGYALPNIRHSTWSNWWNHFLCWCFWLPYFLFFLMFAVIFIQNKGNIDPIPKIGNSLMFYALSLVFLVGGMGVARKLACASGTGVKMAFGKIETGVRKYAPGAAYVRGGYAGLKERGAEIQEKGLFGIGGAQKARIQEAEAKGFVAPILKGEIGGGKLGFGKALKGMREEREKAAMPEIEKEAKTIREQLQKLPADLQKAFLEKQKSKAGIAGQAAELEFVKQGYSKLEDYQKAIERYGGETSAFMRQYLENIKQAKLSDLFKSPDEELRIAKGGDKGETIGLVNLRRELYKDLAKRDRINNKEDYDQAKKLLSPIPAELRSFLDSVKAESVFTTREQRQDALLDSKNKIGDSDLEKKLVEFMQEKKEIADYRKKDTKELVAAGWQLREKALEILGGKETFGGKSLIKEINNQNPVINIEAEMRTAPGAKPFLDNEELIGKIQEELKGKSYADIRKMSGKFFEDPVAQEAIKRMYDPKEIADLIKNSSQEMRRALKDFAASEEKTRKRRS